MKEKTNILDKIYYTKGNLLPYHVNLWTIKKVQLIIKPKNVLQSKYRYHKNISKF